MSLSPEDRARIEKLESVLARVASAVLLPGVLNGDVQGPDLTNALVQIAALAGGGVRFVAVDNAGLIGTAIPPTPPFAMGGDVTGTTAASVISMIAALAGSGTVLVAVDNAGNIISGGAAPGSPDPFAFLQTLTDNLVASSAVRNYDFDLSGAAFTNSEIRLRARGYATTKDTGGVPGANLTGAAYVVTDGVYQNANGVVTFVTAAAGGAANPMPAINNEMTLEPQACNGLQSGGFSPPNLAWTVTGGTTARLVLTATNNANRGSWEIDVYQRVKAAP